MALAVRVIPTLVHRGHALVKGKQFKSWRSVGNVFQAVKVHQARGVDELIILDIAATPAGRGPDFAFVEQLTAECFMPLTVGGGVRSVADVKRLLACGADKVAICTTVCKVPRLLPDTASAIGNQAIVAAIDYLMVSDPSWDKPRPCTVINCGKTWCGNTLSDCITPRSPQEHAEMLEGAGAGEILLTSIDREGTMEGYDLDLILAVSDAVSIPVIAHGGCSGPDDMIAAVRAGASAVAAGALFQFTDHTPRSCAEALAKAGVETRIPA